jgi:hypothetical protein
MIHDAGKRIRKQMRLGEGFFVVHGHNIRLNHLVMMDKLQHYKVCHQAIKLMHCVPDAMRDVLMKDFGLGYYIPFLFILRSIAFNRVHSRFKSLFSFLAFLF